MVGVKWWSGRVSIDLSFHLSFHLVCTTSKNTFLRVTRSCTRLSLGMINIKSQISIQRSSRWAINCTKPAPLQKPTKQPFQRNFVWSLMKSCLLETMLNKIFNTPPPSFMIFCWTRSSRDEYRTIPHICPTHHRGCLCKKFLSGVNFSRLSEKNAYIWLFQRHF